MGDCLQFERDPDLAAVIREGLRKARRDRNGRDLTLADELADLQRRMSAVEAELRGRSLEAA